MLNNVYILVKLFDLKLTSMSNHNYLYLNNNQKFKIDNYLDLVTHKNKNIN